MGPSRGQKQRPGTGLGGAEGKDRGAPRSLLLALFAVFLPSPVLALDPAPDPAAILLSPLVIAAAALAVAGALWGLSERQAALAARDAWLAAGRESLLVWGGDMAEPVSFGEGAQFMEACLTGPDGTALS